MKRLPESQRLPCGGEIVAGPLRNEQGILYAEFDSQGTGMAKRALDITRHFARPEIFQSHVNTQPAYFYYFLKLRQRIFVFLPVG